MDQTLCAYILTKLQELETKMRESDLWQNVPIDQNKLLSTQPFCCDTLSFEQWIQFVFIVKIKSLIQHGTPLPTNMAIAPMAELHWQTNPHFKALHKLLIDLDKTISTGTVC